MRNADHYDLVENYTMKCRLYPNAECAKRIDDAIRAVHVYHNCILYGIFNDHLDTKESTYKPKSQSNKLPVQKDDESDKEFADRLYEYEQKHRYKEGDIVHFANCREAFKADYKAKLIEEHPIIACAPAGALISNCGVKTDIQKSIKKLPLEFQKPTYYNKANPRRSYCYQETLSKLSTRNNPNVLYINLAKVGVCKIRGWNQSIRFDRDGKENFIDFFTAHRKDVVTVKIKKDNCGDYWICFSLQNAYKPSGKCGADATGVDVGVTHLAILADGTKFVNMRFKNDHQDHLNYLMTKQSRQRGWKNQKFMEAHRRNPDLKVSKGYKKTGAKIAKLNRDIVRKRMDYNHKVTSDIIRKYSFIGVESLDVKGLMGKLNADKTNAMNAVTHSNLSDAAMGEVLTMLKYKSEWHHRKLVAVDKYFASSKICSCCGYKSESMPPSIRTWECPSCKAVHDRDVNAARNIMHQALVDTYGNNFGELYFTQGKIA